MGRSQRIWPARSISEHLSPLRSWTKVHSAAVFPNLCFRQHRREVLTLFCFPALPSIQARTSTSRKTMATSPTRPKSGETPPGHVALFVVSNREIPDFPLREPRSLLMKSVHSSPPPLMVIFSRSSTCVRPLSGAFFGRPRQTARAPAPWRGGALRSRGARCSAALPQALTKGDPKKQQPQSEHTRAKK
jgi:hypothetical protein